MNGLLLVNLGTPDAPETGPVRRYLRQFLSDPRVLDMNPVGRALLLNLIILPTRPAASARAYRQIWTERGSPLLVHGEDLAALVQERLGSSWQVELAMRYGNPSIAAAMERMHKNHVERIVVFPLFPQYASSTTGSILEEVLRRAGQHWNVPALSVVEPFYDDAGFIAAFAAAGRERLAAFAPDHVLFSFHGLPERHVEKSDPTGSHCLKARDCCARIGPENRQCYRAHCMATARLLADALDLAEGEFSICFQSRFGKVPWIQPYTDRTIAELAAAGKKRLAVLCPAFVADCIETLEEIGIRGREQFARAGGEELELLPSLNSSPAWADAVVALVRRQAERIASPALLLPPATP